MNNTEAALLKSVLTGVGGDVNALPDKLPSTLYEAIITTCGGTVDDLPDRLPSTYLKRIAKVVGNAGGGSSGGGSSDNTPLKSVGDLEFALNADGASYSFTGSWDESTTVLVIPPTYNGLPVTCIDTKSFLQVYPPTAIIIPNSVTSIGVSGLSCTNVTYLALPNSVTDIKNFAFINSSVLNYAVIPNSVVSMGDRVFDNCPKLETVCVLAETPPVVGTGMFNGCTSLKGIYVPNNSVEAYKSATNWAAYADYIKPIE